MFALGLLASSTIFHQWNRTDYPSGAPKFIPGSQRGSCYSIFSFMCMIVDRCLSFSFGHCLVCSSSKYTDSDYTFGIFKLFFQQKRCSTPPYKKGAILGAEHPNTSGTHVLNTACYNIKSLLQHLILLYKRFN